MDKTRAVVGVFTFFDDAINAVRRAKQENLEYRVYSPVPHPELDAETMPDRSPVRFVTAIGAVTGLVSGFTLAVLCSLDWPLRTSAKDVVSIPGFVVIGYECTILFGALATLAALFHFCRLPDLFRKIGYDPRFSQDKFGVVIACGRDDADHVRNALLECGADEVEVRGGL